MRFLIILMVCFNLSASTVALIDVAPIGALFRFGAGREMKQKAFGLAKAHNLDIFRANSCLIGDRTIHPWFAGLTTEEIK